MAKMVTRTIKGTVCLVMVVNTENGGTFERGYSFARTFKNDAQLLKAVQASDAENEKSVFIKSSQVVEKLYGIEEDRFMQNAVELDPITRKPISTSNNQ